MKVNKSKCECLAIGVDQQICSSDGDYNIPGM